MVWALATETAKKVTVVASGIRALRTFTSSIHDCEIREQKGS